MKIENLEDWKKAKQHFLDDQKYYIEEYGAFPIEESFIPFADKVMELLFEIDIEFSLIHMGPDLSNYTGSHSKGVELIFNIFSKNMRRYSLSIDKWTREVYLPEDIDINDVEYYVRSDLSSLSDRFRSDEDVFEFIKNEIPDLIRSADES